MKKMITTLSSRRDRRIAVCLLSMTLFVALCATVSAEFQGESDWENHKRTIRYKFDESVTEQWKKWVTEAIKNWNDVKDETGWEFVEAGKDEAADLDIKLENIPANKKRGGACINTEFNKEVIKKLTITIDSDVTDETWPDGEKPEGGQNGWGTTGSKTLDPILVIMHELTHAMRLDHGDGQDTGNVEEPITPGNHDSPKDRKPSENDISEAKKAADDKTTKKKNKTIGASGGSFSHDGVTITVQPGTLPSNYTFGIRPLSRTRIPDPTLLGSTSPYNDRGIVISGEITTDFPGEFSKPIIIQIQYADSDIAGGYTLGARHSAVLPNIQGNSLKVYKYDSNAEMWVLIPSVLDMGNNTMTFETTTLNFFFGVGGQAVMGHDPPIYKSIMVFPTPERFLSSDLNGDGDTNDIVLHYQNLETREVINTRLIASAAHHSMDIYENIIAFVGEGSRIYYYDIDTGTVRETGATGSHPSIYENIITFASQDTIHYFDLNTQILIDTMISGKNPVIYKDLIVFYVPNPGPIIWTFDVDTGGVTNTGIIGRNPTLYETIVAFETPEPAAAEDLNGDGDTSDLVIRYCDLTTQVINNTQMVGICPALYGDRIAFTTPERYANQDLNGDGKILGNVIHYYDLKTCHVVNTRQLGTEPAIYDSTITFFFLERWAGQDFDSDGSLSDSIVDIYQITGKKMSIADPVTVLLLTLLAIGSITAYFNRKN
jgi:hypothetical protein